MLKNSRYYQNRKVLITGGAGFIGSHLTAAAVKLGARVTILDNFSTGHRSYLADLEDKITIVEGDILNRHDCDRAIAGNDIVFHCAALSSVPLSLAEPYQCTQQNIIGTANLLEAARNQGATQFIFSSSAAVYGKREGACAEGDPCEPVSPYGWSKFIGEILCRQYGQNSLLHTICLRYFNVFGPRQEQGVVAQFRRSLAEGRSITIEGDGKQERDFVSVERVVEANLTLAAYAPEVIASGEIFNIASGRSVSLLELVASMSREQTGEHHPAVQFVPARKEDIRQSRADCRKYWGFMEKIA